MDPTLAYLWSRHMRPADDGADWAIALLQMGHDSDAIRRLTDRHLSDKDRDRLTQIVLAELSRTKLLDPRVLTTEYERASIEDYFEGCIDGPFRRSKRYRTRIPCWKGTIIYLATIQMKQEIVECRVLFPRQS